MPDLIEVNVRQGRYYVEAFCRIQSACWPNESFETAMRRDLERLDGPGLVEAWLDHMEALKTPYPTLRIFWKDRALTFRGMCRALASESGLGTPEAIIGLTDSDPQIVWNRQGAKYRRDDRDVMSAKQVNLNILERQDVETGGVRWLRTSKAPVLDEKGAIGIVGAFDIISMAEAKRLAKVK
ncbi:MAG: PAS domain-containing protein, partial [Myxococcales bacterium]|nr:PAS domain-containing protein [Myxococcales bacterium]